MTNKGTGEFGVKWQEFGRNDREVTKERFFETEAQREKFTDKVEQKDNFWRFVAWTGK